MKKIVKILNKDYHFKRQQKFKIKQLQNQLKQLKIMYKINDEETYFYAKLILKSVLLKQKIDEELHKMLEEVKNSFISFSFTQRNNILIEFIKTYYEKCGIMYSQNDTIIFPAYCRELNQLYTLYPAKMLLPTFYKQYGYLCDEFVFNEYPEIWDSVYFDGKKIKNDVIYFNEWKILKIKDQKIYIDAPFVEQFVLAYENNDIKQIFKILYQSYLTDKKMKKLKKLEVMMYKRKQII